MLIQNWMSRPVVTIGLDASMQMAKDLLAKHDIHAVPVVQKEKVVGLLTDGDLKRASASDATSLDIYELGYLLQRIKVAEIMTPNPKLIQSNRTLAEAADIFLRQKAIVLPVLDGDARLVGIISPSDLSRAFLSLTAYDRKGIQIGVQVEDRPGVAMDIAGCVRTAGGRIASLISTDTRVPHGHRQVYLRIYHLDHRKLADLATAIGKMGILLYMVDHENNYREIFAAA
jgi:acetoin utilization protein AcuB